MTTFSGKPLFKNALLRYQKFWISSQVSEITNEVNHDKSKNRIRHVPEFEAETLKLAEMA